MKKTRSRNEEILAITVVEEHNSPRMLREGLLIMNPEEESEVFLNPGSHNLGIKSEMVEPHSG
jgi:hypothetical protein